MAYNPVSAARLPPDDPFFTAEGTLAEPEVSQSHRLHKTHGSAYAGGYAHNTFGEGSDRQAQYADRPSHMTGYALSSATGRYAHFVPHDMPGSFLIIHPSIPFTRANI